MGDSTPRRGRGRPPEVVRRRPGEGAPLEQVPADYAPTTRAILGAAHRVVQRRGAQGLTMVAVAREANVDITTVSYHFGTRAGLIEGLMDHLYRGTIGEWAQGLEHAATKKQRGESYFQSVRSMITDSESTLVYFEIATLALRDPALRARLAHLNQWTVAAYVEAIRGAPTPERALVGELLFAAVDGIGLHEAIGRDANYPVDALLQLLERLVMPLLIDDELPAHQSEE